MLNRHPLALAAWMLAGPCLAAGTPLECYEEPGTMKQMCIAPSQVRVNGSVRSSPLYLGGPGGVNKTPYFVVSDCKKSVSTLQDAQGVNFAGGMSSQTKAMGSLSQWICNVPKPRQDSKLRQF